MMTDAQVATLTTISTQLARDGKTTSLAEYLDHGVPVDIRDGNGNTLLMLATYHGHESTVRLLLARGADPNARNDRDQVPIAGALFKGEDGIVQHLKNAGADLTIGSPSGIQAAAMFERAL